MFSKIAAEFVGTFWLVLGGCGSAVLAAAFPQVGIGLLGVSLAFVVASQSPRRIHVVWASYCEFNSDDDYTESYSGKLSGAGRITYYPHVFDGATNCDVAVNADPVKGARVVAAVYSY